MYKINLKFLWKKTKKEFNRTERLLINCYIGFLRKVAKEYLQQGRKVFFKQNTVVHWGEYNFGTLIIEGNEDVKEVFGDNISEIQFESEIKESNFKGCVKVTDKNLNDIKYRL